MPNDDDLHLRVVDVQGYAPWSESPVTAFEVHDGDALLAVVWFADDPSLAAAGVVTLADAGAAGASSAAAWSGRLRDAWQQGKEARQAVLALQTESPPRAGAGRVDAQPLHQPDVPSLRRAVGAVGARPRRTDRGPRVGAAEIDAVLRGDLPPTSEIRAVVADLDAALLVEPTSEPLLVVVAVPPERDPAAYRVGDRVIEPTYLRADFATKQGGSGDRVLLKVPAGVPAIWTEAGGLLLARDLVWLVDAVRTEHGATVVEGTVQR